MMKYSSVSIPEGLIKLIENFIKNDYLGYKSVAEFIKVAIREKMTNDAKVYGIELNGGLLDVQ